MHYDPSLPLRVAADASAVGLGAVLSHVTPDGVERPVASASMTLSTSEKKVYSSGKGGARTNLRC